MRRCPLLLVTLLGMASVFVLAAAVQVKQAQIPVTRVYLRRKARRLPGNM